MQHLEAVVFDWAGTMIDFGSLAPMGAFVEAFASFGVEISVDDARGPMGMVKLDHIQAIGALPHVAAQWASALGGPFDLAAAERVYAEFLPKNAEVVTQYAQLISGAAELVETLRAEGLKIGSTTGYTREIMERILPLAEAQGYRPDSVVCAFETHAGRPSPAMMYQTFLNLQVSASSNVVKVDDTEVGIAEGIAAGSWTVGVAATGNVMGLSEEAFWALDEETREARLEAAREQVASWGCDYVIDSVDELWPVLLEIDADLDSAWDDEDLD